MLCLPFGPANVLTSAAISACITCRPAPTARASSPVPITRPRVRAPDGSGEVAFASYELFSSTELLDKMALERMLAGLSTRRYPVGLEPVGGQGR
jgi:hypothetical protein